MIRPATEKDIVRTSEIHTYGWRTAFSGFISEEELFIDINVEMFQKRQKELLASDEGNFDILDDGIIRGLVFHGKGRDQNMNHFYEIYALYIEPQFKNRGYGQQLVEHTEHVARSQGFTQLIIWTLEGNTPARKFYESRGYITDGTDKFVDKWKLNEVRYIKTL